MGMQPILRAIDRIAGIVRDRLSLDTWRIIRRLNDEFPARPIETPFDPNDILYALDRLILSFAAFGGLATESMTRGFAWRFLDMGRRMERAAHIAALLSGVLVQPAGREHALLEAALEIADNSLTYRRRYMTRLQAAAVVDLLLADESNPRSVAFQIARLTEHVESLPRNEEVARLSIEQRIVLQSLTDIRLLDAQALVQPDAFNRRSRLDGVLTRIREDMKALSDRISQGYLSHAMVSRQLAGVGGES
jgi:uncharacterized alpha-E superfamily protein